jgi:hypothetical protein
MLKYLTGEATTEGGTTKTSLGTIVLPSNAKRLVGAWCYANGGAGITTLENISGICELESPDVNLQPCQFPIEQQTVLTSGVGASATKVWPMNAAVPGNARVTGYLTLDLAQTVDGKARFGLVVECA